MNHNHIQQLLKLVAELVPGPQQAAISEYDLLEKLRTRGCEVFTQFKLSNSLELFRCHFLLYHLLYLYRDQLRSTKLGDLQINAMSIRRLARASTDGQQIGLHDALREYYLDFSQYESMQIEEVERLITSFWSKLIEPEQRTEALAILDLQDPVSDTHIKRQYRKLAMQYHPDRGGNTEDLQRLNKAMQILAG